MHKKNTKWTKECAIAEYRAIRKKYGDKAKSNWWVQKRYGGLCYFVRKSFIEWWRFKKICGFNESPLRISWSKKVAISEYRKIRKKHGDNAKSSGWMIDNGYSNLINYVKVKKIGWNNFKNMAGFIEEPLYRSWGTERLVVEYRKVILIHGVRCSNTTFLKDMGFEFFIDHARNHFGSWQNFLDFYNFSYTMSEKELEIDKT